MIYALRGGERVKAEPRAHATCPLCGDDLVAKCGEIYTWHWSHTSIEECDPWYENETQWHLWWKAQVEERFREVTVGPHRADIKLANGRVVELQGSPIDPATIREREQFYGDMLWIVDAADLSTRMQFRAKDGHVTFRWPHPRPCWYESRRPLFLDLDPVLLAIQKLHPHDPDKKKPCRGWGHIIHKRHMISVAEAVLRPLMMARRFHDAIWARVADEST